jgi:hypothetical protein
MKYGPSLALALAALAASCATDPAPAGDPDANSEPPADEYALRWGPITVQPGVENVQCVVVRLGNDVPVKIHEIHNVLGDVSHHFIIYKTAETEERPEPHDCDSIENLVASESDVPLMITQKYEELLTLPEGVAFELEANAMLRLELHYINAGDAPKDVQVDSRFIPIADADFEHAADFLFIGNPDIQIPPGQSVTLGPTFLPLGAEFADARFFGITGHQHQWGTSVTVATAADADDPGTMVYDIPNFDWDEPETVYYDPPFSLPQYGGFRFTCQWENQGTQTAYFGEGVEDEMCFFWAYYYPSRGHRICFHTERGGSPLDVCCPGDQLCNLVGDYLDQ